MHVTFDFTRICQNSKCIVSFFPFVFFFNGKKGNEDVRTSGEECERLINHFYERLPVRTTAWNSWDYLVDNLAF